VLVHKLAACTLPIIKTLPLSQMVSHASLHQTAMHPTLKTLSLSFSVHVSVSISLGNGFYCFIRLVYSKQVCTHHQNCVCVCVAHTPIIIIIILIKALLLSLCVFVRLSLCSMGSW
jgi:hypothetical protein